MEGGTVIRYSKVWVGIVMSCHISKSITLIVDLSNPIIFNADQRSQHMQSFA